MTTIAESLGAYAASLKYEDLPPEVVHQVKRIIIDTLGCAFGGYSSEPAKIARDMAELVDSKVPATVLCSGKQTSPDLAVFANDVAARYLDYNDGYIAKGSGHPSDSIAPLIAASEVAGTGGRELITATAIAYEVYCRITDVWNNKKSGIDHVTIGGMASVVGAARVLGLTEPQIVQAINLMVVANVALNQTRCGNISNWKACAYANASRNAIFAAQLAKRGMTGPSPVFEGRDGFFKVAAKQTFELEKFGGKDQPFKILKCHLKQFPLGNFSQSVVTAILQAREEIGGNFKDITEVQIKVSEKAMGVMADSPEKWRPQNRETADHSIPYTAAVALMYGTINEHYFDDQHRNDAKVLALVDRVKCSTSEEATRREAEVSLCELTLVMGNGENKSVRIEYHRGHWRNPMTDAEVETKFRSLVGDMLPKAGTDALLGQLWKLESVASIKSLVDMTRIA